MRSIGPLLLLLAAPAAADSYKGVTLNAPVPDTVPLVSSQLWSNERDADTLPTSWRNLCLHEFLLLSRGSIEAASMGCDGPVVRITALAPVPVFTGVTDLLRPQLTTDIAGLRFHETTLADARALLGSEGLRGGPYGNTEPNSVRGFSLGYGLDDTDILLVLSFQLPLSGMDTGDIKPEPDALPANAARDAATLVMITVYSAAFLDFEPADLETRLVPSAGYAPLTPASVPALALLFR